MFPQARVATARRSRFLYVWLAALLFISLLTPVHAATPARGLSSLHAGPLSVGYLNAIRRGIGTTPQNIAALNYEAIDIISLAFTLLNPDGSFDFTYGSADLYRPYLITSAHAHSCAVLMSVVGDFQTVTAAPSLRQIAATNIANALVTYGFDGVDFDWEWPNTVTERDNFTAFMQAVHATVTARSTDYIIMFVQGPGFWLAGTHLTAGRAHRD